MHYIFDDRLHSWTTIQAKRHIRCGIITAEEAGLSNFTALYNANAEYVHEVDDHCRPPLDPRRTAI